jgi:uncharacterized protein involved in exopolysaccharide biosynthesis
VARSNARAVSDLSERMIRGSQDPSGSGTSLMAGLYRTLLDREAELSLLRQKFTDKNPEVVQARRVAEGAQRTLETEVRRQLAGIQSGASPLVNQSVVAAITSQARAEGLQEASRRVAAALQTLPAAQATYTQLNLNLRDERSRLALVRAEYVKSELIAQSRGPQFVILDPPAVPRKPNGYSPLTYAGVGFVLLPLLMAVLAVRTWIQGWFKVD